MEALLGKFRMIDCNVKSGSLRQSPLGVATGDAAKQEVRMVDGHGVLSTDVPEDLLLVRHQEDVPPVVV